MAPETRNSDETAESAMAREAAADGVQGALRALFPLPPEAAPRTWARRGAAAVVQIAAVGLGAWVLLLRIPGLPSWDAVYAEDYWAFLWGRISTRGGCSSPSAVMSNSCSV
jgi:hypothetical protein